jgi:hypothetical protein
VVAVAQAIQDILVVALLVMHTMQHTRAVLVVTQVHILALVAVVVVHH